MYYMSAEDELELLLHGTVLWSPLQNLSVTWPLSSVVYSPTRSPSLNPLTVPLSRTISTSALVRRCDVANG